MKVLLVRFSAIGDCVMAAHAATCVRRSHPNAHLVWAVEERCSPVVDAERLVSRVAIYPRERWKRGAWSPRVWREQWRYYAALRQERFDVGIDLQGHSKTAICLRLSGAKRRLAVRATDPLAKRLNPRFAGFGEARHTVDRQLAALRSLGEFLGEPFPPMMPRLEARRAAIRKELGPEFFVAIAVGAGHPEKAYPRAAWMQVAERLRAVGLRAVAIGGPEEAPWGAPGVDDRIGRLDLKGTMAVIAEAAAVLAADTGAGHLAAAYGVPYVSIFGPTDPEEFRPYGPGGIVLKESGNPADVLPERVAEEALRLIEARNAGASCAS